MFVADVGLLILRLVVGALAGGLVVAGSAAVRRRAAPGRARTPHRTIQLRR